MTRFDERLDADQTRSFAAVGRIFRSDRLVHAVAITVVMVVLSVAAAGLLCTAELASRWSALTARVRLTALLDPQLPRAEAERLKTSIEALPQVASATFKTREDALARLADAGLPAIQSRANPLPDAWMVVLAPASSGDVDTQRTRVERLRAALAGLPGVESVQSDTRWIDWIDRWAPISRSAILWMYGIAFGVTGWACLGTFFLVGRAVSTERPERRSVLAIVGFLGGALGCAAAAALVWSVLTGLGMPALLWESGRSAPPLAADGPALGALMALALAGCALGAAMGRARQTVTIDTIAG